jgi:dihydropteroate synthase
MKKYYTRACNFTYGKLSIKLVNGKKNLPLKGNKEISFDEIEIISRNSKKIINIKDIKNLPKLLKIKVKKDLNGCIKFNTG